MNDDRSSHCAQMNWSPAFRKLTNADGRKPVTAVSSLGFGPSSVGRSSGGWRPADGQLTAGGRWLPARAPPAARPFHGKWRLKCRKRKKELCWRNCKLDISLLNYLIVINYPVDLINQLEMGLLWIPSSNSSVNSNKLIFLLVIVFC